LAHSIFANSWIAANAGIAVTVIIAAMTNATVTNNMMRLTSAAAFVEGEPHQPRPVN
jgi:hypothetical protein